METVQEMSKSKKVKLFLLDHIIGIVLLVLIIALSFASPAFLTTRNWLNILKAISMKGVIAFGMTMVIISGQIDLSIGSGRMEPCKRPVSDSRTEG